MTGGVPQGAAEEKGVRRRFKSPLARFNHNNKLVVAKTVTLDGRGGSEGVIRRMRAVRGWKGRIRDPLYLFVFANVIFSLRPLK